MVERMAMLDCSIQEVTCILMCSDDTLDDACKRDKGVPIKTFLARYRAIGDMSLRRKQMKVALEDGNVTMLRWLGIQRLGQSPKVVVMHKVPPAAGGDLPPPDKPQEPEGFEIDGLTDMEHDPNTIPAEGRTVED